LSDQVRDVLDGLIVESPLQAEAARRVYKLDIPVAAIPHLGYYCAAPRREPGPVDEVLRVAFLGRYDRKKGIYRLLDMWPQLTIQPARLDFYGHGSERDQLVEAIRQRGLEGNVQVNGGWADASELAKIMSQTDLVVLPSKEEGLPVILLEAMAHGVPFVASDVGAVRTLAEDNPDVLVVPLDNGALKAAIEEMAAAIRTGRVQGDRLQDYHQARYSYEILSRQWIEALLYPEQLFSCP
jgi:glycosyltransferase involved in cell wall biosynthesis